MKNGPYELVIAQPEYPGSRYRGRYCYEHHLVWWQNTGEVVTEPFLIHHRDENKRNNAFGNLEKKTRGSHAADHAAERPKKPTPHGTKTGYNHHRCRCDKCRAAHARATVEYRKTHPRKR